MGQVEPKQPTTTYAEFKKEILNEIARCLNMPFNIAAGNSSGYNYASGRLDHQTYFKSIRVDQAFMAGIARSIELQQADATAVVAYKRRLIEYLERFIGDLVGRSGGIAQRIESLSPRIEPLLWQAAQREARDSAPDDEAEHLDATTRSWQAWRERWRGLRRWFVTHAHEPPQAELLR